MNLSKKVLASILLASAAGLVIQCGKSENIQKNKSNQTNCTKDTIQVDTISNGMGDCPSCGMG